MKFGLFFLLQHPEWKSPEQIVGETLEQIEYAEELGYDGIWVAEHHFSRHGICGSPLQLLASAAVRTHRIRLGLAVAILPFNHPIHMAEQSAMLDILSQGRLDFGIGRGYLELEFKGFGLSMEDSTGLFRESLDIIRRAWAEETISHHGKHYRFDDLRIAPKPVQRPHPPIYVASVSPPSLTWSAQNGFPIMSTGITPWADLKRLRRHYQDELTRHGFDGSLYADCPLQRQVFLAETTEEARALAAPALEWGNRTAAHAGTSAQAGQYTPEYDYYKQVDRVRQERAATRFNEAAWADLETAPMVGDPAEVLRRVRVVQEALDLGYLMTWMNFGGIDHQETRRSMKLFAREVMPHFRARAQAEPAATARV